MHCHSTSTVVVTWTLHFLLSTGWQTDDGDTVLQNVPDFTKKGLSKNLKISHLQRKYILFYKTQIYAPPYESPTLFILPSYNVKLVIILPSALQLRSPVPSVEQVNAVTTCIRILLGKPVAPERGYIITYLEPGRSAFFLDSLTPEDGTDSLFRNVGTDLPFWAA
jgi:hypothetical protein